MLPPARPRGAGGDVLDPKPGTAVVVSGAGPGRRTAAMSGKVCTTAICPAAGPRPGMGRWPSVDPRSAFAAVPTAAMAGDVNAAGSGQGVGVACGCCTDSGRSRLVVSNPSGLPAASKPPRMAVEFVRFGPDPVASRAVAEAGVGPGAASTMADRVCRSGPAIGAGAALSSVARATSTGWSGSAAPASGVIAPGAPAVDAITATRQASVAPTTGWPAKGKAEAVYAGFMPMVAAVSVSAVEVVAGNGPAAPVLVGTGAVWPA